MQHMFFFDEQLSSINIKELAKLLRLFKTEKSTSHTLKKNAKLIYSSDDFHFPTKMEEYNLILSAIYNCAFKDRKPVDPSETYLHFISLENLSYDLYQSICAIDFLESLHFHIYILSLKFNIELTSSDIIKIKNNLKYKFTLYNPKYKYSELLISYLFKLRANKNITFNELSQASGININTLKFHSRHTQRATSDLAKPTVNAEFAKGHLSEHERKMIKAMSYHLTEENAECWSPYISL